jgi:hypothetical protein
MEGTMASSISRRVGLLAVFALVFGLVVGWGTGAGRFAAQEKPAPRFEYALMKYDGPDRIQIFYPDRFEYTRLFQQGHKLPKDARDEEYCVAIVINNMAKDGWLPIQLHATRVLFQRPLAR